MAEDRIEQSINELARVMREKFTQPEYIPGCEVLDITDIDEYATGNGWIEARCAQHNRQRVRYKGVPAGVQVNDFVDVEYFPNHKLFEVRGAGYTSASSIDNMRVSEVWQPDGAATVMAADTAGDANFSGNIVTPGTVDGVDVSAHAADADAHHARSHAMTGASDHVAGNWKLFHSNGSGAVVELALGAAGTFLRSNGAAAAPSFGTAGVISHFLALPGLRGLWPMAAVDASGNTRDLSGNGLTLVPNGNPTYDSDGLAPYIALDGTGDFFSRSDTALLDILGTESYMASPGLTLGGWFWFDAAPTGNMGLMAKYASAGNQRAYLLYAVSNAASVAVSTNADGALPITTRASSVTISTGNWYFIAGRFVPSTSLDVFNNGTKNSNTTSIPATLFNSSAALQIGRFDSADLNGRASLCFLCAAALSDAIIDNLFRQSRALFGV